VKMCGKNIYLFIKFIIYCFLFLSATKTIHDVLNKNEGNLLEEWHTRNKVPEPQPDDFFSNLFKRHGDLKDEGQKELKNDFTDFINEMRFIFNISFLALSIFALYLFTSNIVKIFRKSFFRRNTYVLIPGEFNGQKAHEYLDNFDMFLDEEGIDDNDEKCSALLSRLNSQKRQLLLSADKSIRYDYEKLKQAILKLYKGTTKTKEECQIQFLNTNQGDYNLNYFYAELYRLANKA